MAVILAALRWFWSPPRLWKALTDEYRRPSLVAVVIFLVSTIVWGVFGPPDIRTMLREVTRQVTERNEKVRREKGREREQIDTFFRSLIEAYDKEMAKKGDGKTVAAPVQAPKSRPRPFPETTTDWGVVILVYLLFEGIIVSMGTIVFGIIAGLPSVATAVGLGSFLGLLVRTAFSLGASRVLPTTVLFLPALLLFVPALVLSAAVGFRVATCLRGGRIGPSYIRLLRSGVGTWAKVIVPTTLLAVVLQALFLVIREIL